MTVSANYPAIRPSLLLDFANTKQLDPRITFSRPTTATYYDGKTVVKAEENLLTYSEQFDNAAWSKFNSTVTANSTTAPDGTTTSETLTANTATSGHNISRASSFVGGNTYTISVYAKKNTVDYVNLSIINSSRSDTFVGAAFNLNTGVVSATNANGTGFSVTSTSISNVGSGWYRCILTAVYGILGSSPLAVISINNDGTVPNNESGERIFTGTGTESIYIWGAQLEQRSTVTAYTPTTTAPITNYIPALQTAAAGVPRFDHDPVTGESLGLLIEEQRTNLLTYSSKFGYAEWYAIRSSITSNTITAPDGTLTADKLVEDTQTGAHHCAYISSPLSSNTYTSSLYIKAGERTWARLQVGGTVGGTAYINLATGEIGTVTPGFIATVTSAGNGWYRCTISGTASTLIGVPQFSVYSSTGNNNPTYAGDGTSGIYIWGAQLEAGSFATSYIPTTSAQVTRSADVASITGANFTSWYRTDEGSLYTEINTKSLAAANGIQLNDGTTSNRIRLALTSASDQGTVTYQGSTQATLDGGTPVAGTTSKVTIGYKLNDFALSLDGGAVVTNTSGVIPGATQLQIGAETSTAGNLTIKRIAYFPARLSNANLQAITS